MPIRRLLRAAFQTARGYRYSNKRLVEVRISRECLLHNYRVFSKEYPDLGIAPVIKSNAYGHGLIPIAKILEEAGPPLLLVEAYYEALLLRKHGIKTPILVMGYTATENIQRNRLPNIVFTLVDYSQIVELSRQSSRPQLFHLKVDTGMRRYGIAVTDLDRTLTLLKKSSHMHLVGAYSHMAVTTKPDDSVAKAQIREWNRIAHTIRQHFPKIQHLHLASSGGSFWSSDTEANIIRIGIGIYGFDESPRRSLPLRPVLSLTSTIGSVRKVLAGESIGYDHTFTADREMTVATVVSGYFTGIDRRLSNRGALLVRGIECPIVGLVCMNATMIDVSQVNDVRCGDAVTLISPNRSDTNSVINITRMTGDTLYVTLTGISPFLLRTVT